MGQFGNTGFSFLSLILDLLKLCFQNTCYEWCEIQVPFRLF